MSEWISVKDRLPDSFIGCLVYEKDNGARMCREIVKIMLDSGEVVYSDSPALVEYLLSGHENDGIDYITHITHWMPLPEPPKEESE